MAKTYDGAKPSVGRIVHYYATSGNGPFAAIIVDLKDDTNWCNLFVFPKFSNVEPEDNDVLSATYSDEPKPGCWTWPPRV